MFSEPLVLEELGGEVVECQIVSARRSAASELVWFPIGCSIGA